MQDRCLLVLEDYAVTVNETLRLAGCPTGIQNVQWMREAHSLEIELICQA